MAVKTTKNTKSTAVKRASSSKKSNNKVSWLKKRWIPVVVVLAFASVGAYLIGTSNAATNYYVSSLGYQCPTLPTLKLTSSGDCVRAVQKGLNNRNENLKLKSGTAYTALRVSGTYNAATVNAVKAYQTIWKNVGKKVPVDGVMGAATWDRFLNDCLVFSDPAAVGWHAATKGEEAYYTPPGYLCGGAF